jgi:hypothetical protein
MAGLRPAEESDVPQLAELHRKAFGTNERGEQELQAHLLDVFCRHPWRFPDLQSLVYEDAAGRIVGSLGIVPRQMWMKDRPIRAAISHNFMVEPSKRSSLVAVEILQRFFSGPQDLSIAEGNGLSRRMWEQVGGRVSSVHSIRWIRPMKPARYLLSLVSRHGCPRPLAWALTPGLALVDVAARHWKGTPFRRPELETVGEPLDVPTLLSCLLRFSKGRALRPGYDLQSLSWLLQYLERRNARGQLRRILVRKNGEIIGWFLYYAKPGEVSELVQIGARSQADTGHVLRHLFDDAWSQQAVAVSGQLEPFLMPALSEEPCLMHRGRKGTWFLLHSHDDRILHSFDVGDAFFTRLEGEWWIGA